MYAFILNHFFFVEFTSRTSACSSPSCCTMQAMLWVHLLSNTGITQPTRRPPRSASKDPPSTCCDYTPRRASTVDSCREGDQFPQCARPVRASLPGSLRLVRILLCKDTLPDAGEGLA